jgi:hypothetical protein
MVEFKQGLIIDHISELDDIMLEHHKKHQTYEKLPPLVLDWATIISMERQGDLVTTFLYINKEMKGIYCSSLNFMVNYTGVQVAHSWVVYIDPSLEGRSKLLKDLIIKHEEDLREKGVEYNFFSYCSKKDLTNLVETIGYTKNEIQAFRKIT